MTDYFFGYKQGHKLQVLAMHSLLYKISYYA